MDLIVATMVERGCKTIKPIPGFSGNFIHIHAKPLAWKLDGETLRDDSPITIYTTSNPDKVTMLTPWQCKKDGELYGAKWVGLTSDEGKRKYFRIEKLAQDLFGKDWETVKANHEKENTKAALGGLF